MSTTPTNNQGRETRPFKEAPCAANAVINQGDILILASNLAISCNDDDGVLLGVSQDTNPVASLGDTLTAVTVLRTGTVRLKGKSGDTFAYGTAVYPYAEAGDAQTVTTTQPGSGKPIGHVAGLTSITGDGSKLIEVDLCVIANNDQ